MPKALLKKSLVKGASLGLALLLAGCSSLPEPQYPPADLPKTTGKQQLVSEWKDHSGYGERWRGYELMPALDGDLLVAADAQGLVQAFDLSISGFFKSDLLWSQELDQGVSAGLTLADGNLYLATQNGELLSLDARTGNTNWQVKLSSEALTPAQVKDNLLVVLAADGQLTALDTVTGRQLWTYASVMPSLSLRGSSTPSLTSLQSFTGLANGKLVAIDNNNGQVRWQSRIAQPSGRTDIERLVDVRGQAKEAQGLLLVNSYQGQTHALDPFTGRSRWSRDLSSYHAPAVLNNQVFVVDEASRIHALDLYSGTSLWTQDALYGRELTEPVILENSLVVADYQGYLHLLDPKTGEVTGRKGFDLDGIRALPIVNNNRLLVHSIRGRLGLFTLKK
ncbi:outer membrane protein assembly factor BamB [Marinospirillum insulare]|uniref:Outer membrane protein assembly factor BamB n=1 Tax=Marinospirillum insulare TaxID=217169 RepID=A0ABQ6A2X4_9GAMM|nr:outer membrane protein assembly factor BamB [Marinospirillum insulare]GLR65251.1 outer membrane protein assembly factor BamB [Marinospirillum insulare]